MVHATSASTAEKAWAARKFVLSLMRCVNFHSYGNCGDNFWHLNYLRRMAEKYPDVTFVHHAKPEVFDQLPELVRDLDNLLLKSVIDKPGDSIDAWIGAEGYIWSQPGGNTEHIPFMMGWFGHLSKKIGLESAITEPCHLLLNYPALLDSGTYTKKYDFMVVNSKPNSGQFRDYTESGMDGLVACLHERYKIIVTQACSVPGVPTTAGLTLTNIGNVSLRCDRIIGIATGPIWPTFNVWNHRRCPNRVLMLDNEFIRHDEYCVHARSIDEATYILKQSGLL